MKRWFSCKGCRNHVHRINQRFPNGACERCGKSGLWEDAGMRKEAAAASTADEFLPRGEEHSKFRGGYGGADRPAPAHAAAARACDPPQRVGAATAQLHNAFASKLPEM